MNDPHSLRREVLRARAHRLIPGGAHTYSKGDDLFCYNAPTHLSRCRGAAVWDTEGNEYLDWTMGINSVILGHAHPAVTQAVARAIEQGSNFSRPWIRELELAEILVDLIPSAEMVKYAKNGSDATSAAVRLARAWTGRERVAICIEHPFFSQHDWFIGRTAMPSGIPVAERTRSVSFHYNDLESLKRVFEEHPGQIAAVLLEPVSIAGDLPAPGFLEAVRALAHEQGALLIFDEIVTGFRWDLRGAQHRFGVTPDLSAFGKAVANGFSFAFLAGRREIMELGGIRQTEREKVFMLSSTYGGEPTGIAAALATIDVLRKEEVLPRIWESGAVLREYLSESIRAAGLEAHLRLRGHPPIQVLQCLDEHGVPSWEIMTAVQELLVDEGLLAPYFCVSLAHDRDVIARTRRAFDRALSRLKAAFDAAGRIEPRGYLLQPVFRPFNAARTR